MKKDMELLDLAARACGMTADEALLKMGRTVGPHSAWNPLKDDGDALRLAVHLGMRIDQLYLDGPNVCAGKDDCRAIQKYNGDRLKATRRAIVKCAAVVGRFTPSA